MREPWLSELCDRLECDETGFWKNVYAKAYSACLLTGVDAHDADDAVQAAMGSLLQKFRKALPERCSSWDDLLAYVSAVARNATAKLLRARSRRREGTSDTIEEWAERGKPIPPDTARLGELLDVLSDEQRSRLVDLIPTPPARPRRVAELFLIGIPRDEIVQRLGLSGPTVRRDLVKTGLVPRGESDPADPPPYITLETARRALGLPEDHP